MVFQKGHPRKGSRSAFITVEYGRRAALDISFVSLGFISRTARLKVKQQPMSEQPAIITRIVGCFLGPVSRVLCLALISSDIEITQGPVTLLHRLQRAS